MANVKAYRIKVIGKVQGVGFRPFIHRLAVKCNVKGYVKNLGGGEVEIFVEGEDGLVERFIEKLKVEKPSVAQIEALNIEECNPQGLEDFKIVKSSSKVYLRSEIPVDLAMCKDCLREVLDPNDRRYRYPFNSCAYCGPRFSILERLPYDRENITMRDFPLCNECLIEYEDLWNIRRYNAKGISCPKCGPKVWLVNGDGEVIPCKDPLREVAKLINEGFIVAIKGLGGFHIASLATDDDVVLKLRRRKNRPQKPFALMAKDLVVSKRIVEVDSRAVEVLTSPQAPIVLLPRVENCEVSKYVAPGLTHLGVMLAYTPLHYLVLNDVKDEYAIMTSGNVHGRPMVTDNERAIKELKGIVDYLLLHNRRIVNRIDDSVVRFTCGSPVMLRRARGYAPSWIKLPFKLNTVVIAFGAELQNAGGVAFEDKAVLTQFIGDTDEYENLEELEKYLLKLINLYHIDISKSILVSDLHPNYNSQRLAKSWSEKYGIPLVKVQHHIAHMASAMADAKHDPKEPAVGISIDGVGYGLDGNVWGGEVLLYHDMAFHRAGHLKYNVMPGGDIATKYPTRMLISLMYGSGFTPSEVLEFLEATGLTSSLPRGTLEFRIVTEQCKRGTLKTSSIGRLLDAFAAFFNVCTLRTYEGEPAIKLEAFSERGKLVEPLYNGCEDLIVFKEGKVIIDTNELFTRVYESLGSYKTVDLAYTVQAILGRTLGCIALGLCREHKCKHVYVSGGAAVNNIIVEHILKALHKANVKVHIPLQVPPGDGGIALGQMYYYYIHNKTGKG